jgi:hypothetical protein
MQCDNIVYVVAILEFIAYFKSAPIISDLQHNTETSINIVKQNSSFGIWKT